MKEYKIGETVYIKIGIGVYPVEISSITIQGNNKIYGVDMVFRRGAANEIRERIADATQDNFYIMGIDGCQPCT